MFFSQVLSNVYVFHLWYLHSLKDMEENWWRMHCTNKFDTFFKRMCDLYFDLKFSNISPKHIICTFYVSKLWANSCDHLGRSLHTPEIKTNWFFSNINGSPLSQTLCYFPAVYQVLLTSITVVRCSLNQPDFILCVCVCVLLAAN